MGDVQIVEIIGELPRFRGFDRKRGYPRQLVGGVERDLHLKVRSPDVTPDENTRDVMLEADDAEAMLDETRSPEAV